jgi:Domain of unknown function (DUF5666)
MKKGLALSVAAVFCLALAAAADQKREGKKVEGTISSVDLTNKTMTIKAADGTETTVYWNDTTKVEGGALKEGEKVHVKAMEKDGKMWATYLHVGEMKKM